jgi:hypothetical protein
MTSLCGATQAKDTLQQLPAGLVLPAIALRWATCSAGYQHTPAVLTVLQVHGCYVRLCRACLVRRGLEHGHVAPVQRGEGQAYRGGVTVGVVCHGAGASRVTLAAVRVQRSWYCARIQQLPVHAVHHQHLQQRVQERAATSQLCAARQCLCPQAHQRGFPFPPANAVAVRLAFIRSALTSAPPWRVSQGTEGCLKTLTLRCTTARR